MIGFLFSGMSGGAFASVNLSLEGASGGIGDAIFIQEVAKTINKVTKIIRSSKESPVQESFDLKESVKKVFQKNSQKINEIKQEIKESKSEQNKDKTKENKKAQHSNQERAAMGHFTEMVISNSDESQSIPR